MLIPIAVVLGTATLYRIYRRPRRVGMTGKRQQIYESALVTLKQPEKLRALAAAFEGEGLIAEADLLKKRAEIRELPKSKREERRAIFRRAIQSSNIPAIRAVAAEFRAAGCTGAAANLYAHADSLVEQAEAMEIEKPPVGDFPGSPTVMAGREEDDATANVEDDEVVPGVDEDDQGIDPDEDEEELDEDTDEDDSEYDGGADEEEIEASADEEASPAPTEQSTETASP
jgi:hypothetical protein